MAFLDPDKALSEAHIEQGSVVVDFGSGSGAYAIAAGKRMGDNGHVYAVDVQDGLLSRIRAAASSAGVKNVETVHADIESGTPLASGLASLVIISNTLFQVEDKNAVFKEAGRLLGKNGKLLLIDWSDSFGGLGPQKQDVFVASEAKKLATVEGFTAEKEFDAGDHHYGVIFRKN
ncbi:MAG: methyltransferase domain-containing protein [Patescibacteria group bacterium]